MAMSIETSSQAQRGNEAPKEPSQLLRNRDEEKSEAEASEAGTGKSLLEGNGFKVIKKIGSGSYSKVKLAYSEHHKAMVAVKIVSKYHVPDEFLRKFLYNEIRVVKFLRHENIIKYYQSIESSHRLYVIMQHAENGSILDLIHKERRLSEPRACTLFRQMVAAVEYCHSQSVCHRDIKCENILLDANDVVKLIDFGFAKCYKAVPKTAGEERLETVLSTQRPSTSSQNQASSSRHQQSTNPILSETYCGSYAYASPEILKGNPYDPFKSDVWALGCVLFAMVFGRLPFDDRDPSKLIKQVQAPVSFPSKIEVSEGCKDLVRRILSPLRIRFTIADVKDNAWFNTAHLDQSLSTPVRKLSTR